MTANKQQLTVSWLFFASRLQNRERSKETLYCIDEIIAIDCSIQNGIVVLSLNYLFIRARLLASV